MREIKFRVPVYSHLTGKFLKFEYWAASHMCFSCDAPNLQSNDNVYGDDEQFTGLRDKNNQGKAVYDGDTFKNGGVVIWRKSGWWVHFKSYDVPLDEYIYNDPSRETVGTIHDVEVSQ